jgi:hypothetical protein
MQDDDSRQWHRYERRINDVSFDVEKTQSLVSPYTATVAYACETTTTDEFATSEEAEHAQWKKTVVARFTLHYALQDRRWVAKSCDLEKVGKIDIVVRTSSERKEYNIATGRELSDARFLADKYPAVEGKID